MSKVKVGPRGPRNAKLMVVGEAPGQDEVREGKPFVGKSGQLLNSFLMQVGIDPTEVFYTNVAKYRPDYNDLGKFFSRDGIPGEEVREGLLELIAEIKEVKPNLILAVGAFPSWLLTGKLGWDSSNRRPTGIQKLRGSMYDCRLVPGTKVLCTFHPAYILREGMQDHGAFACDLGRAKEEMAFPELRRPDPKIIVYEGAESKLILNPADAEPPEYEHYPMTKQEMREHVLQDIEGSVLTIDIEYISKNLLCCGVTTTRDEAHVLVTNTIQDVDLLRSILTSGIRINAQNAAFEASILEWHYRMPIMPHVWYDTMLAAHAANPELPKDLGYLTSIYTDQPYHKDMVDWNKVKKGTQPMDVVWKYNGIDTWTEHAIMEEQMIHDLTDPKVMATFQHEMRLLGVLWDMSKRGIRIDTEKLNALRSKLESELSVMQGALAMFNGSSINTKSQPQVAELLHEKLGLPVVKRTTRYPATDDKTLAAVRLKTSNPQHHAVIDLIRDIRQRRDLISKFLDVGFSDDGRARGHYNPGGTTTGRLSSSKFYPDGTGTNQQNIPRDDRVRSLYVADPGYEFGYADLERAESLVVAHLTNDPRMLADHAPGTDAHKSLASVLFSKPQDEITKDERYLGKQTRHAGNYMQGWKTFQTNVNQKANKTGVAIDAAEAKRLIQVYRDVHPFLPQWWKEVRQELWRSRTLYTLLGRRRIFYGHIDSILPEAVAYAPQGTVGDVLNVGLLALHGVRSPMVSEEGWDNMREKASRLQALGFQALNQVHDAVGYQYPIQHRDEVSALLRELLSVELTVPKTYETFRIPVEVAVGPSWGELEVYTGDLATAHA